MINLQTFTQAFTLDKQFITWNITNMLSNSTSKTYVALTLLCLTTNIVLAMHTLPLMRRPATKISIVQPTLLLHAAIQQNSKNHVYLALQQGANPNKKNKDGLTPLASAIIHKAFDCIPILIENGATPAQTHQENLLFYYPNANQAYKQIMISRHAALLHARLMPIYQEQQSEEFKTAAKNITTKEELIDFLKTYDIDLNIQINKGETLVHFAAYLNYPKLLSLLIELGADYNKRNKADCSPLTMALENRSTECVNILMEKDAQYDASFENILLFKYSCQSPENEKITEDYTFFAQVHSALLCKKLMPLYQQQLNNEH